MAEYIYNEVQTVQPGASALLSDAIPCNRGLVLHRPGSGILTIRGVVNNPCARFARYRVAYDGNIAIPEGGTMMLAISGVVLAVGLILALIL